MKYSNDDEFMRRVAEESAEEIRAEKRRERAARITGAHTTMPIEDRAMVKKWLDVAKEHDRGRVRGGASWYLILIIGFNTGLRIGDICKLKVKDVRGRERVSIEAEKTGKMSDVKLQDAAREAIDRALDGRGDDEYILTSRQGSGKPITRQRVYGIMREIARRAGFEGRVGCHTMRKTFAWSFYKASGGDLSKLQKILNHSSQEATIHYLGLDRKAMDEVIDCMPKMV